MAIKINLHILKADKEIADLATRIEKLSAPVLSKVIKRLPFKESVDIVVYRYESDLGPDFTVTGFAPSGNVILVYFDPHQKGFKKNFGKQLKKVLAHELHHACRWQGPGYGTSLLEEIISESLAAHFEREVTGAKPDNFYIKFSNKVLNQLESKARREFNTKKHNHRDWFFGNEKRNIPMHAAYAIGYRMLGKYCRKHKPSSLAMENAEQIYKGANPDS